MTEDLLQTAVKVKSKEELDSIRYDFIDVLPLDQIISSEALPSEEEEDMFQ